MKKKSGNIKNYWKYLNEIKSSVKPALPLLALPVIFSAFVFLSGCAKTAAPLPPEIAPPHPPAAVSAQKIKNAVRIIYKYNYAADKIKGFLIYKKYYKDKKSVKYTCGQSKPFIFQNIKFKKRFSLPENEFYYNANIKNLKSGYYIFCVKSEKKYGIKSAFSNFAAVRIIK